MPHIFSFFFLSLKSIGYNKYNERSIFLVLLSDFRRTSFEQVFNAKLRMSRVVETIHFSSSLDEKSSFPEGELYMFSQRMCKTKIGLTLLIRRRHTR